MSVARRSGESTGIALFPFLAVLLCTMGALLVLLVVLARQARNAPAADDDAQRALRDQRLAQRRELESRIAQARAEQAAAADELARLRAELDALAQYAAKLDGEREQLRAARGRAVTDDLDAQRRALAQRLVWYENKIFEAEQQLRRTSQASQQHRVSYAIVPYVGPGGTRRRPIYIECRSDRVILQPEGIQLRASDFVVVTHNNPLVAALQAAVAHWRSEQPAAEEPYPLLLVRPDGIDAYYASRAAMAFWGGDFGYELIDADWSLEFADPDPRLAQQLTQAVARSRALLSELLRGQSHRFATTARPSYTVGSSGLVPSDGSGGPFASGRGGSARGDAEGEGPAASLGAHGWTGQVPGGTQRQAGDGGGATSWGEPGFGSSADGLSDHRPPGSWSGGEQVPLASHTADGSNGWAAGAPGGWFDGPRHDAAADASGTPWGGTPSGTAMAAPGGSAPAGGAQPSWGWASATPGGPDTWPGDAGTSPGGAEGAASGTRGAAGGASGPSGPAHAAAGGTPSASGTAGASPSAFAGSATGGASAAASAAGPPSGAQAGSAGSEADSGNITFGSANVQRATIRDDDSAAQPKRKPVVRDDNWGLPRTGQTPVARRIHLLLDAQTLAILPENAQGPPLHVVPLAPRTEDSLDALRSAVWRVMDGWGVAGPGMYWKPTLYFDVAPGGLDRFQELKQLLAGSGYEVHLRRVLAADATPAAAPRR
jgi:hypothetical protein